MRVGSYFPQSYKEIGDCPAVLPHRLTHPGWKGWPICCTLQSNHIGDHIAGDGKIVVAIWSQLDNDNG